MGRGWEEIHGCKFWRKTSQCQCVLKDLPLYSFDEALGIYELIDDQNSKNLEQDKEATEKVLGFLQQRACLRNSPTISCSIDPRRRLVGYMALEIPMEGYAKSIQERNNERMEILKAKKFENLQHPTMLQEVGVYGELMDPKLFHAATKGDVDNFINTLERVSTEKKLSLSTIFGRVSPSGNSLLHEAARFGNKEIVELIAHHFPSLLTRTNIVGDTALHVATKAKKSNIIDVLINVIPREDTPGGSTSSNADGDANYGNYQLLRMKNQHGNTALNEAVRYGYLDGVECLFSADNQVAYHINTVGRSPLSLAVKYGKKDILVLLLEAPIGDGEFVRVPQEASPVYAAIIRKKLDMLEEINKKRPMLLHMRDEKGKTALHFAASVGDLESIRFLLKNFSQSALERSKKGDFPIHMASKRGYVEIVKELLQVQQQWPVPTEILRNKEGQNILHVAAKNGRKDLVQDMLRNPQLGMLLNEKDNNGNTPLHLASTNLHPNVLVSLAWDKRVFLNNRNNDGMTAMDLCELRWIDTIHTRSVTKFRKLYTFAILKSAGSRITGKGFKMCLRQTKEVREDEEFKDRANILALITILVATVTFAAGITVPGGFLSSDKVTNQGMAILVNRRLFQVFIICDTMAMFCSIIATFILLWVQLGDSDVARSAYICAYIFCSIALSTMSLAFMSAVYLVVSKLTWLANVVVIMGIIFLALLFGIHLLMSFPIGSDPFSRFMCRYTIPWMIYFTARYDKGEIVEDKQQKKSQPVKEEKQLEK